MNIKELKEKVDKVLEKYSDPNEFIEKVMDPMTTLAISEFSIKDLIEIYFDLLKLYALKVEENIPLEELFLICDPRSLKLLEKLVDFILKDD